MRGLKERFRKFRNRKVSFFVVIGGVFRLFFSNDFSKIMGKERGYAYFQDFIPFNNYDIRIIVIDNKAFAIKRMVRNNDFRASGSGNIIYEKEEIDKHTIELSFEISEKLKSGCLAFDFVYDNFNPLITEVSYGFSVEGYDKCPGYWDNKLNWHEGTFNPQSWMVDMIANDIRYKKR
ncbi:hypothetical protein ES705_32599 [subsurface metagenome]